MTTQQPEQQDWRYKEFKYDRLVFQIASGVLLVIVGTIVGFVLFPDDTGYRSNLYTSILSIAVAIFVLDLLARRREERQEIRRLVREARSGSNDLAIRAVEELRDKGLLTGEDSLLKGANLERANLVGADLSFANLRGANMWSARLKGANLEGADLTGANLQDADLRHANLEVTDFSEAVLGFADLRETFLEHTDFVNATLYGIDLRKAHLSSVSLRGADLSNANLHGATIEGDKFNENTILPDGTKWRQDIDWRRFTAPPVSGSY